MRDEIKVNKYIRTAIPFLEEHVSTSATYQSEMSAGVEFRNLQQPLASYNIPYWVYHTL